MKFTASGFARRGASTGVGNRVLVYGGRDYSDYERVNAVLDRLYKAGKLTSIIEGGARGADRLARQWAVARGVPYLTVEADWAKHGKSAGPIRNQEMIKLNPAFGVCFPGGKGTADMTERLRRAKVPIFFVDTPTYSIPG